jgi:hypothetical protein
MATRKLQWNQTTNIFGTSVTLRSRDGSYEVQVSENMGFDPISRLDSGLKDGYLFRSPNIESHLFPHVFESLNMISGAVNIWVEQDKKSEKLTGYAVVQDKMDAGMFAFANVENWQKWSADQETEAKAEAKKKPQKVKINKDGTITVKVTATTLADDPQDVSRIG